MRLPTRYWTSLLAASFATGVAIAGLLSDADPDAPRWEEETPRLPEFPAEANLREFYVSATTPHRYFIDAKSLSVGQDGVVRYTLVVRTPSGVSNITYEGLRCATGQYKIYATGHADGAWGLARHSEWRMIEDKPTYRHHAALAREYFCPLGLPIATPAEGLEALRLGKHPRLP
jgi:hypothetical protein